MGFVGACLHVEGVQDFLIGRTMGKFGLTKLTMARTWGKPPPSPYSILYGFPRGPHPNGILSQDSLHHKVGTIILY
jgi:hypothetical protein